MRRVALTAIWASLLLSGCGGGSSPSEPTIRTNLTGIVHELNPPTFTRIPGASVTLQGRSFTTDARGEFRALDLTPGSTVLSLTKAGFRSRDQTIVLNRGENTTSQEMLPAP